MLDCSRNAVPKVSTVKKLIDVLQSKQIDDIKKQIEEVL